MDLIIFTAIDDTLANLSESDCQAVATAIENLQRRKIPLIPVSNKTRAEISPWLDRFNLIDPFIVERGSGIFIHQSDNRFQIAEASKVDNYCLHQFGCSYTEARAALKVVQEEINKILRGFGDLDESNIQPLIGGTKLAARQAKAREFSEYFLTPNRLEIQQLQSVAEEYGFRIVPGKNLSLILGAGANIAKCIDWIEQNAIASSEKLQTVGIACTEADLAMLEKVDLPLVIPTSAGIDPCFRDRNWQTVNGSEISGWIQSIEKIGELYL